MKYHSIIVLLIIIIASLLIVKETIADEAEDTTNSISTMTQALSASAASGSLTPRLNTGVMM